MVVERRASHTNCVHGSHYSSSKTDKETRRQTQRQTQRQIKRNTDYHTKQTNLDKDQPCDGILCSPYPSSGLEPNSEACCLLVLPVHKKPLRFRRCRKHLLSLSSIETQFVSHYQCQNYLIALHITRPTGRMALTPSFPVLVLMKSLPAIMHTRDAFEWFYFVKVFYERVNDIPCRHWSYYPAPQWPKLTSCELNHMLPDAVSIYITYPYVRIYVLTSFIYV